MFWNKKVDNDSRSLNEIKTENEKLNREISSLTDELDELMMSKRNANLNATSIIDFDRMCAFSIERAFDEDERSWCTIIGYWKNEPDNNVGEWKLWITPEHHEKLCQEFSEYISMRKGDS